MRRQRSDRSSLCATSPARVTVATRRQTVSHGLAVTDNAATSFARDEGGGNWSLTFGATTASSVRGD